METTVEITTPPRKNGALNWMKENLFSTWYNSALTFLSLFVIAGGVYLILRWVLFVADWAPVINHPLLYLVGQYPREALWRPGVGLLLFSFLMGMAWRVWGGTMRNFAWIFALFMLVGVFWPPQGVGLTLPMRIFFALNILVIYLGYLAARLKALQPRWISIGGMIALLVALLLLRGFPPGAPGSALLPFVPTNLWGGLMVTIILSVGGIVISFPFGVLLALGRRSSLPVVRLFCTIFIEVVRGVPLVGILLLTSIMLPLFFPPNVRFDRLLRALAGMTVFSAAYMAENVRGGLAAIPPGQVEAAKALGLSNFRITAHIVLPQALRLVIPPIVGQFISLFKDTTLAAAIAVLDFLAVARSILQANPEYIGKQAEVLIFVAAVFWVLSYLMSYASQRLETALGVGER